MLLANESVQDSYMTEEAVYLNDYTWDYFLITHFQLWYAFNNIGLIFLNLSFLITSKEFVFPVTVCIFVSHIISNNMMIIVIIDMSDIIFIFIIGCSSSIYLFIFCFLICLFYFYLFCFIYYYYFYFLLSFIYLFFMYFLFN